jgi:hypothetical protein
MSVNPTRHREFGHAHDAQICIDARATRTTSFAFRRQVSPGLHRDAVTDRSDFRHRSKGVAMISAKLIELIEINADRLTKDVARDIATNPRTPAFRVVPQEDLEERAFELFHHLGNWIGNPRSGRVEAEFTDWGRRRFDQGIPLSEIVYALIILKHHLRRYIGENGLVDAAFPRIERDYVLPMHLHSLQDLNVRVGEFFDEALYYLSRGYEGEASRAASTKAHEAAAS